MARGILYIVATPIGNLQDITLRALEVLKNVGVIAAEDTRHSQALLQHYGIKTTLVSLHVHNEQQKTQRFIDRLLQGDDVALISDAGTPLISDPGYTLVSAAHENHIQVVPIPGASALLAALSVSGLPADRFAFEGFLAPKSAARKKQLDALKQEARTLIFYEAPHRIVACLEDMAQVFGDARRAVIARELTKMYESIERGSLRELIMHFSSHEEQQKGEFVILVEGHKAAESEALTIEAENVLKILLAELPLKQAVKLAAKITGLKKNALYDLALQIDKLK